KGGSSDGTDIQTLASTPRHIVPILSLVLAASVFSVGQCGELGCYEPQEGDLLIFQSRGLRNLAYSLGCSGGATHCGVVVARQDGSLGLLEAPGPDYPVMISDIPSRLQAYPGRTWVRRRRCPLTPGQSRRL